MGAAEVVHPVPADEIPAWTRAMATTFLEDWTDLGPAIGVRQRSWRPERVWGARAGGRWVATLSTLERRLTVPGPDGATAELPADALTAVTVGATHRRQGLLSRMITESLRCAVERGDPLAILQAAEWPIYGRFGYAPAAWSHLYRLDPRRSRVPADGPLNAREVTAEQLHALAPAIFGASRAGRAGNIDRPGYWWDFHLGQNGLCAPRHSGIPPVNVVIDEADGPAGYAVWSSTPSDAPPGAGAVTVRELHARTASAYRALWAYVTGIDLVGALRLRWRPVDEPARHLLTDGRALRIAESEDALWLRLLDVPAALGARGYACRDRLVVEVVDDAPGGYAAGVYELDGGPDGATCRRVRAEADLRLEQRVLAAAYLGGRSLAALRHAGPVDQPTPGAARRLDAMLATPLAPWCGTDF